MSMVCVCCKETITNKNDRIILPCEKAICINKCLNKILKSKKSDFCCPLCNKKYNKNELNKLMSIKA